MAEVVRILAEAGVESPVRNAEWMMGAVLGCNRALLYAHPDHVVSAEALAAIAQMVRRRAGAEPLQYILGYTEFYGLRFQVDARVLIPRPETEVLVSTVLDRLRGVEAPQVLDVGTGSGCIAIAIKATRKDARVYACDLSEGALDVARANAHANDAPITFFQADCLATTFVEVAPAGLDALVANPPYVPPGEEASLGPEVVDHEPQMALFSPEDPLYFYRALLQSTPYLVKPGGIVAFETHADYAAHVAALAGEAGIRPTTVVRDLAGRERVVVGVRAAIRQIMTRSDLKDGA